MTFSVSLRKYRSEQDLTGLLNGMVYHVFHTFTSWFSFRDGCLSSTYAARLLPDQLAHELIGHELGKRPLPYIKVETRRQSNGALS